VAGVVACATVAVTMLGTGVAGAATPTTTREISTAEDAKLGTILVAETTVYTLDPSGKACSAKCLKVWRPVLLPSGVKKATAGSGVDAKKLGTTKAAEGARQVTYDGSRLYWFAKDTSPGDVKGNGSVKGGTGAVVVTSKASGDSGGTDTGTGGVAF
jgi:predicted lipoprotein with Yx(FWY)xxD motif